MAAVIPALIQSPTTALSARAMHTATTLAASTALAAIRAGSRHAGRAALALSSSVSKIDRAVLDTLAGFRGLPHRMAPIADLDGGLFVDDSKGTTVAATQVALEGVGRPVVLIAGGDGKGQSFAPLKASVDRACRAVLLIGRDAPQLARALAGSTARIESVGTLQAAVERARSIAVSGDIVLLSPACASLDQFRDYVERGNRFAALVNAPRAEHADA
jgi:UDP-N-acetylmuramoylalanine--D-glutamate ligase